MVVCPNCQHESVDRTFCDHCNSFLPRSVPAALPATVTLADGRLVDCSGFHGVWPSDCFTPLSLRGDFPCRVYALSRAWWRDLAGDVGRRAACSVDVLGPIHVVRLDDAAVVVAEALPAAVDPLPAVSATAGELAGLEQTLAAGRTLAAAMASLHQAGLVWLNFDATAVEAAGDRLRITNLDLQVFRAGACPDSLRLSPAFSPPEVCSFRAGHIGPATDVFHLALYAFYRLAGLLPHGFPGRGLEAFHFDVPGLRIYRPRLLPGVAGLLARGMAADPAERFGSPAEFLAALEQAVARLRQPPGPALLACDCGSDTVIGRTHELAGLPNQDDHTLLSLGPNQAVFIVADGVTSASVGSGDLASWIAVEMLAWLLPESLHSATTEEQIEAALGLAFLGASEAIVRRSIEEGIPPGIDLAELMSSTALVGYLHGDVLTVACTGDSRAYLVRHGQAEQLTVDGDVRCAHLAAGAAPEEVRDLGPDGLALYSCLGVSEVAPDGRLVCSEARSLPQVCHWRLQAGDVVVLCSDGLVEEGVFLGPDDLVRLVGEPFADAQELARRLVAAACDRHRGPSVWEPTGCGDDVTCVVLALKDKS
jgi:serine/threonine protein phosphatase PrpC